MNNFQPGQLRILVADDEESTLAVYRRVLSSKKSAPEVFPESKKSAHKPLGKKKRNQFNLPFDVVICRQGDEAVETVKKALEENRHFAVAFLDVRMPPGPDGVWASEQIRTLDPAIEIVLVTAFSDVHPRDIAHRILPTHKLFYIQKPLHPQEIYQFASALSSKWDAERELRQVHEELEKWIEERTVDLVNMNEQLKEEIEERKQIEEALRKSEERHRIVLEAAPDPVVVYDMEGRVTYLNPAFSRIFGWTLDESKGQRIEFVPENHLSENQKIFEKINHGEIVSGIETCRLTQNGHRVKVSISGAGFFDSDGLLQGSVITIQDVTVRKRTEEERNFLASHDVLTGLPNRKSFYMRLEDKLVQSRSRGGTNRRVADHKWALLFLDLDRFKNVNDTLGHDIGDELLTQVAARLQHCVRKSDHIFRLGGDEFTIILNDLTDDSDVAKVAKKVRKEVARPYRINGHEIYMAVSIGISVYPDDGENVETLVKNADIAMYAAKEEGQGYRFFTEEMNRNALERMMLEGSLRYALQHDQFTLFYQPLVDDRNRIVGMEALLRWQHPDLGMVSPSKFIPLAEETGAIIPIGKWVLHAACEQAKKCQKMSHTKLYVAVNLSIQQLRDLDFVETVEQVLEATDLPPDCLKLEVTESGIMEDPEQAIAKMKRLRTKGIHFSIDDFGTGYSSLSYLKRFPIDTLKIDRSFVMDAPTNKDDQEIIKTILAMAQNLNLETVAEGVETEDQQTFLIRQGCHMMQGYYFGRPMPADKFEEFLQTSNTVYPEKNSGTSP